MREDIREKNIAMFKKTLDIAKKGRYTKDGKSIKLILPPDKMREVIPLSPEDVEKLSEKQADKSVAFVTGRVGVTVSPADSFGAAMEMAKHRGNGVRGKYKVLVLNFANPVHPGGGVSRGASAQEEDLCRKSTLYLSLKSEKAKRMYDYNYQLEDYLASDYMLLSPNVEIIRGSDGELLPKTQVVAVLTAAAPMVSRGRLTVSQAVLNDLLRRRIRGILHVAAQYGYSYLILGAWGCGAFGNDAENMARLFYEEIKGFSVPVQDVGMVHTAKDYFNRIEFAVLDRTREQYNYKSFEKYFGDFYADERIAEYQRIEAVKKSKDVWLDRFYGCLMGGAAGDALGYPVEFMRRNEILRKYGPRGIEDYKTVHGKALISDDTQMTLFTATGLLSVSTRKALRGIRVNPTDGVWKSYEVWYRMQMVNNVLPGDQRGSWLKDVPEMAASRAPGNTCLSALAGGRSGSVDHPINNSKGCGGIMRVAPVGLYFNRNPKEQDQIEYVDRLGAEVAALTHGHALGYLPAAVLVHIINRIMYGGCTEGEGLDAIVKESLIYLRRLYGGGKYTTALCRLVEKAMELAKNDRPDAENICALGQGWVAEETLAIAVYCSLRYRDDFSGALCASVNHDGDSDSTGAVTGNIVGALVGYERIPKKWKNGLECSDVIMEIAQDLCYDCLMREYGDYRDEEWIQKYLYYSAVVERG